MQINLNPDKLVSSVKPDVIKMLSSLKPGQTVSARVISQEPDGNAVLDFPFGRITLNLDKQFAAGERVWFEAAAGERQTVGNKESSIVLKLLDQPPASRSSFASGGTDTGNTATVSSLRSDFRNALTAGGETSRTGFFDVSAKEALLSFFDKGENAGTAVLSRMPEILLKKGEYGQGATVTARVIGMKGRDKALLSIKGEEIESKVSVPLQEGRIVFLEKAKSGDSKEFRILQPDNVRSSENLAASAQSEGGTGAFPKIVDLLAKLQIKPSEMDKSGNHGSSELFKAKLENLVRTILNSVQADSVTTDSNDSKNISMFSESVTSSSESLSTSTESLKAFVKNFSSAFETIKTNPREGIEKIKDLLKQALSGSFDISSDKFAASGTISESLKGHLKEILDLLSKTPADKGGRLPEALLAKVESLIGNLNGRIEKLHNNMENLKTENIDLSIGSLSVSSKKDTASPPEPLKILVKDLSSAFETIKTNPREGIEKIKDLLKQALSGSFDIFSDKFATSGTISEPLKGHLNEPLKNLMNESLKEIIKEPLKELLDLLSKTPVDKGGRLPESVLAKVESLIGNLKDRIEKLQDNIANLAGNIQEKLSEPGSVHSGQSGQSVNTQPMKNLITNLAAALDKMRPDEVRLPENIQSLLVSAMSDSSEIPREIKNAIKDLLDSAPMQPPDVINTADGKFSDGKPMSLEAKMEKLMATLQDIALKSEAPQEDFIHNLIKGSGISWENRISEALGKPEELSRIAGQQDDIKAILLDALSDSSLLSPDVGKALEAALDSLENLQMLNRMSVYDGGVFVLPFPVFSDNRFTFGQIFFDFSERQDKENREKPFRVSVLLDMTALGKVRADLSFMKKALSGTVIVDSESSRQIIAENLPELEKKLVTQGFESANFGVRFPRSQDELESSSIFSKMVDHSGGLSLTV